MARMLFALPCIGAVSIVVDEGIVSTVPPSFLSVTMDVGQFYPEHFWKDPATFPFDSPVIQRLAKELSPAIFRVGGTEAEDVWYDIRGCFDKDRCGGDADAFKEKLPLETVDSLYNFAKAVNMTVAFGLNGGRSPRSAGGHWTPDNALELVSYVVANHADAAGWWELGNEPEAWFGTQHEFVSGHKLASDALTLRSALDRVAPNQKIAGMDFAGMWKFFPPTAGLMKGFLESGGAEYIDAFTYHFYPYIGASYKIPEWALDPLSRLIPFFVTDKRAVSKAFDLTEAKFAAMHDLTKDTGRELWLGEGSLAAVGGRDGVTNCFASSLFYLFELGQAAITGHSAVLRQALTGASYSLVDSHTLRPMPDYWAAVLHKRLMGSQVHHASVEKPLRAFAHCHPAGDDLTVLVVNPSHKEQSVTLEQAVGPITVYLLRGSDENSPLSSASVVINGQLMEAPEGVVPEIPTVVRPTPDYVMPPYSAAFFVFPFEQCAAPSQQVV